ncbi:Uncharacterized protein GBIM_16283 [Gryllus bimaculatus]|nr:Uncharacterized protein GBIM_16283 [Gryllus bimaculatus]
MLVEESTSNQLPVALEELILSLKQNSTCAVRDLNKHDLIVCVLCALMKECDLQPLLIPQASDTKKTSNETDVLPVRSLPNIWKNNSTHHYNISFVLGHFLKNRFRFIGIPSKDSLIVNVIICGLPQQCYSMSIVCDDYVRIKDKSWDSVASVFFNLRDLSVKFKNSIAHPVRSAVLNEEGILNASLLGIPYEIQLKILGYLNIKELAQIAQTCQYFSYLSKDQRIWKDIARTVMTKSEIETIEWSGLGERSIDWKKECREALRRRCKFFHIRKIRRCVLKS